MKKRIFALMALLTISSIGVVGYNFAVAEENFEIKDEYNYGDTFIVPEYKNDGVIYSYTVTLPNEEISKEKEIKLDLPGVYNIVYMNGGDIKEYSFTVKNPLYTFSGNKSSAQYETYALNPKQKGLMVNLAEGETMTFNNVIDLEKYSSVAEFITFFVAPNAVGRGEFTILNLQLTDVNNPDSYVKFRVKHYADDPDGQHQYSYVCAGANGQALVGYEVGWDTIHVNDEWGTAFLHSFFGRYDNASKLPGDYVCSLSLAPTDGEVKVNGSLVSDLNDPKFYSSVWEGFKSNKVVLSITGSSYTMESGHFMITSLLDADISKQFIDDREPPVISIDVDEEIPLGLEGKSYPIFNATALDRYSGECKVHPTVYYNYGKASQKYIIVNNNRFPTDKAGEYTIVYSSKDYFGNRETAKVVVNVVSSLEDITVTPEGDVPLTSLVGEKYILPTFKATGGAGHFSSAYYLVNGNERTLIEDSYIRPEEIGNLKIVYEVSDFIGQTKSYDINLNVVSNPNPVFYDEVNLPKYFISGSEYVIPEVYAYDFSSGAKTTVKANVEIKDANLSTKTIDSGEKFTPLAYDNGSLTKLTFKAKNTSLVYEIPTVVSHTIVSGREKIIPSNFFVSNGIEFDTSNNSYLIFEAKDASTASWEFANPLLAENLNVSFTSITSNVRYSGLNFTLTDTVNANQKLTISLVKKGGKIEFRFGNKAFMSTYSFDSESTGSFSFGYKNGCVKIGTALVPVASYDDGSEFKGFSSMKVYLSSSFVEGKANAKYGISMLNNQILCGISSDRVGPSIAISGNYGGTKSINEQSTLPSAFASDVFDPNVDLKMTVTTPTGEIAKDINGNVLENIDGATMVTMKFDQYGQYVVSYVASDVRNANPNITRLSYAINIADEIKPTVKFKTECQTSIKVNEFIIIPEIEIEDNFSEEFTIIRSIKSPSGYTTFLEGSSNSMKAIYEGIYEIRILVLDSSGNTQTLTAQVSVTK